MIPNIALTFTNYGLVTPYGDINLGQQRLHYNDVIMCTIASQITSLTIVYSDADKKNIKSSASLGFVRGIHRGPVNSPHKWPVTRNMLPFYDVIMQAWALNQCWLIVNMSSDIHLRASSQKIPQLSINEFSLKITYLKYHSNFPGTNELLEI